MHHAILTKSCLNLTAADSNVVLFSCHCVTPVLLLVLGHLVLVVALCIFQQIKPAMQMNVYQIVFIEGNVFLLLLLLFFACYDWNNKNGVQIPLKNGLCMKCSFRKSVGLKLRFPIKQKRFYLVRSVLYCIEVYPVRLCNFVVYDILCVFYCHGVYSSV